ncbi:MAG TPA: RdgB/HAM1 family non-canonical purine NTP pyrophosphatase [Gemmatimonadaceae bacterium]|nr:RdgB/HAM1 family non-canonical purine NTP pyrophosphatase [Gemmatimonadaceae bacterium]
MTAAHRYLLATRSEGKLRELEPLFSRAGIDVVSLERAGVPESPDEAEIEKFSTFEENAFAKARYFRDLTGLPTVADDSGLEVRALGGAPGVRSKRWSGRDDLTGIALDEANNAELLRALAGARDRRARYVCVAALAMPGGDLARRGEVEGEVLEEPRGRGGFGYDPLFFATELGKTFGEASLVEKERVSHRGRAFHALVRAMRAG